MILNVGQLSLCPSHVIQTTDPDWLRQYNQFCYELVPLYKVRSLNYYDTDNYLYKHSSKTILLKKKYLQY